MIVNGVITELKPEYDELKDYKFFCFNGKVRFFKVDFGRFVEHHANYYDIEGKLLPFGEVLCPPDPTYSIDLPTNLSDMIVLAERLSKKDFFLRVDLYNVNGNIFFGELTFYPNSRFGDFTLEEWDLIIGDMLVLPVGGGCPRTTDHKSEILQSVSSSDDSCLSYGNNYQLLGDNTSNPCSATYNLKVENSQN